MKKIKQYLPFLLGILLMIPFFVPLTKIGLLPFFLILLCIFYGTKKFDIKHFGILLFLFSLLLRIIIICIIDTPIISDFKTMFDAATKINLGHLKDVQASTYFKLWGYQFGHTLYMCFFLKIIPSAFFLKLLNCIFSSFSVLLLYLIGKDFVKDITARRMSLLYSLFPFPLFLNTVLTNQHHSTCFLLLALYLFTNKKFNNMNPIKKGLLIGSLLALSNILRSEGIVIIIAIFAYFLLQFTKKRKGEILKLGICLFFSYFVIVNGTSYLLQVTNISKSGLSNKDPYWKFITGLNPTTNGQYSEEDAKSYSFGNKKEAIAIIKKRITKNITHLPTLFLKKETIFWTQSDLSWSIGHFTTKGYSSLYYFLVSLNQCFLYFFLGTAIIGCFQKLKRKETLLFILILGAYFGVYLWIEIMPRYAYAPQTILLLLSMMGIDAIKEKRKER